MPRLINISEASKILNLIDPKSKKPSNHILRFWEKEFKQIKPIMINKRRYYSSSQIQIIKMIKHLLKNKGMTISGVKDLLSKDRNKLDDHDINSLKVGYYKDTLKIKSKLLLKKIKKIKSHGKKNSS